MAFIIFWLLLAGWITADVVWWRAADRRVRRLRAAPLWRGLVLLFAAAMAVYILQYGTRIFLQDLPNLFPLSVHLVAYLWHLMVLPLVISWFVTAGVVRRIRRRKDSDALPASQDESSRDDTTAGPTVVTLPRLTRRQALAAGAVAALPPVFTGIIAGVARSRLGRFRVQRTALEVPALPADLDGLTIAHVTDLHIGKFLPAGTIERVADAVNALDADLVVFTGDLIDVGGMDHLPAGIDFIRRLSPRHGLAMIEGNHDVMTESEQFEQQVRDAGLPLLLDEAVTYRVPGRATAVQFLGITWGDYVLGKHVGQFGRRADQRYREWTMDAAEESIRRLVARRDPTAFPILLAHHPHAFDPAAVANLPLTLAGHTHGGQIMLTDHIGAGPLRFKYWTGEYRERDSRLFISNGVGNWFPLRVNAPAEIVHLTLRRGGAVPPG
jgi:predicted MPP superfamily phosphohydrolase